MQSFLVALAQTPAPSPEGTLRPGLSEDMITPGTWGFIATAFVVILTMLLIVDMVRRLRRIRYRAQVEETRAEQDDAGLGAPDEAPSEGSGAHDAAAEETAREDHHHGTGNGRK
ncbi:hypothetical protein GCM10012320_16280 [Sinomonas cellulolyticus]|uniref:Uncharacterized protein n=1 Tax=Sinomonas cellulolyticus TaxID=2801916 RepID=A0ABS1JZ08_9MICC|nr:MULTISPECIES: hypothetical protein [Sinomonas]MBL0704453.1 hypothetical protein [Sinomonas cellulolyticus]GHG48760.1 hypothetical protein GCM10012320_16280 [Sinomonas sp. KCTC 49339]